MKRFGNIKRRSEFYVNCNRSTNAGFLTFLGAFAKQGNVTVSFVMSLSVRLLFRMEQPCSHWRDFSRNLVFECFSKICGENSNFIKMRQEVLLYMKTNIHF